MRKLVVIRRKAFAGCLGRVKIYITDRTGDTFINGVKCRFLGILKNNSRAEFEIPCESVKIFAIYDDLTKDYCNDGYVLPEGDEDCTVSGVVFFNPLAGNPFYFDNANDVGTLINRQERNKKAKILFFIIIVSGFLFGFVGSLLHFLL